MSETSQPPIDPFARRQAWCYRGHDVKTRRPLCYCGCGKIVMPPRQTAASKECVDRFKGHSDPGIIRRRVERRDKGVCALCGTDTVHLLRTIRETTDLWRWLARRESEERFKRGEHLGRDITETRAWGDCYDWTNRQVREQVKERGWDHFDNHAWEADHIVPVAEGGGGCDHTGYRTLCIPCHKQQTKALAARLAQKRREAKRITTLQLEIS